MADLRAKVASSAARLREALTLVSLASGTALPSECYKQWIRKAELYQNLTATDSLFSVRDVAWKAVLTITSSTDSDSGSTNLVKYGAIEIEFPIARHLVLTSYAAVTWSIYDRLANVCGRLMAIEKSAENPTRNPKTCEDFLGKEDILGSGVQRHLKQAYAWPLRVTYKVRNWLVHEGYEDANIRMFKGERIGDGFILHEDAVAHLQKCCSY